MDKPDKPVEAPVVACEVCLKQIPKSEAKNAETEDYVLYFCGIECYGEWERTQKQAQTNG